MNAPTVAASPARLTNVASIFLAFLRLGLTSFGGPVAHLGYFRNEFVIRRHWLDEHAYADTVALCQFLPGPASSQVGIALGFGRGGLPGAIAAWIGFTLPSAVLLVIFAMGLDVVQRGIGNAWLHGLELAAVAIVAQALWGMGKSLAPDRERASMAVGACVIASLFPSTPGQIGAIIAAASFGWLFLEDSSGPTASAAPLTSKRLQGTLFLALFVLLLLCLPPLSAALHIYPLQLFDSFYRTGALVFGGGHVVLPLLRADVVPPGWISDSRFMAGYGAAQAVPGPLFTFSAFLGAASSRAPAGWEGALIALVAIFLPGFLLVIGTLPFWEQVRRYGAMRRAMLGVNAAVVGLLLAAFFNPVWTSAVHGPLDFCAAVVAFLLLALWKVPPWLVVILSAVAAGSGLVR